MFLLLLISDKYSIVKIKFYKIELFGKIFLMSQISHEFVKL